MKKQTQSSTHFLFDPRTKPPNKKPKNKPRQLSEVSQKILAVFLVVLMTTVYLPQHTFSDDNNYFSSNSNQLDYMYPPAYFDDFNIFDFDNIGFDGSNFNEVANNQSPTEPPPPMVIFDPIEPIDTQYFEFDTFQTFNFNQTTSPRRLMYQQLLEGNYFAPELISRFQEMFGVHSATYIRENFTTIFDINEYEIDEGILNIIAPMRIVRAERLEKDFYEEHGFTIQEAFERFDSSDSDIWPYMDIGLFGDWNQEAYKVAFDAISLEFQEIYQGLTYSPPLFYGDEYLSVDYVQYFGDFFITTYPSETMFDPNEPHQLSGELSFDGNSDVSIRLISTTNNSIIVETFFNPTHFYRNNILRIYDFTAINPPYNGRWIELSRGLPSGTRRHEITNIVPGAVYRLGARTWNASRGVWVDAIITIRVAGARTPSLTVTNTTNTSVTVNAIFPSERDHGNRIRIWNGIEWSDFVPRNNNLSNGNFTLHNLTPGVRYQIRLQYINRITNMSGFREVMVQTPLPPERMLSFSRSDVEFRMDEFFVNSFNPGLFNAFLDSTNHAYGIQHNLVGGNLPFNGNRMRIETSRHMYYWWEGLSGHPITWSVFNPIHHSAINHTLMMNRHGVHVTETPIHEIAHNFQSSRWLFEAEALAIFQTYYHFYMTGESMVVSNRDMVFTGGSGFKRYMRSYANRILGHIDYDRAMSQDVYSPYSLAWNLADIQKRIGWEPFGQTFRAFDALHPSQVPTTNIGKFNLFLTMLSDFSGQDVFNMFNAQERAIYQAYLGGVIQRVSVPPISLENHGVVYTAGVLRPITSTNDANVRFDINNLGINTANRWLTFNVSVHTHLGIWTFWGDRNVFNNPSQLRRSENMLGTSAGQLADWELEFSFEEMANSAFLLPINVNRLSNQTIIRFSLRHLPSGNIYYFEDILPDPSFFNRARAIAWNTSATNRVGVNNGVHWYLNHPTQHGPASPSSTTGDTAGFSYNLTRIRERVGHQPFNQAFAHMTNLSATYVPPTQLGRVNLFLTRLREYSGQDVVGMMSSQTIRNLEQSFGGRVGYVSTIHWSNPLGNQIPSWTGLTPGDTLAQTGRAIPIATRSGYQFVGWSSRPANFNFYQDDYNGEWDEYNESHHYTIPLYMPGEPDVTPNFRIPSVSTILHSIMVPNNISVSVQQPTYWGLPPVWRPPGRGSNISTNFNVVVSPADRVNSVEIVTPAFWLNYTVTRNATTGVINVTVTADTNTTELERFGTIVVRKPHGQADFVAEVRQAVTPLDPFFAFY